MSSFLALGPGPPRSPSGDVGKLARLIPVKGCPLALLLNLDGTTAYGLVRVRDFLNRRETLELQNSKKKELQRDLKERKTLKQR